MRDRCCSWHVLLPLLLAFLLTAAVYGKVLESAWPFTTRFLRVLVANMETVIEPVTLTCFAPAFHTQPPTKTKAVT